MIFALQKFRHNLLGGHFKFFIDHSTLKYLVKNPILEVLICRWFLLFQDVYFKVIFKLTKYNHGFDNILWLETTEYEGMIDD